MVNSWQGQLLIPDHGRVYEAHKLGSYAVYKPAENNKRMPQ